MRSLLKNVIIEFLIMPEIICRFRRCCYNEEVKTYKLLSQRLVHFGEEYKGGEVLHSERQVAFDFILDMRKLHDGRKR